MSTLRLVIFAAVASAPCAFAADSTKPALPQKPVPPFELKTKSSFSVATGARNPFLPIGWKGAAVSTQVSTKKQMTTPADAFRVTTIIIGSPSVAVINGRHYEEGQLIRMPKSDSKGGASQVRAKLYRIGDGIVQIQLDDQMINVPLDRGKLKDIQPELLLDPERE